MKKTLKKSLSTFLAILMLLTCFSATLPLIADAAASTAQWNELVAALSTTEVSSRVTSSTVANDNGAVWRAAEALYAVLSNGEYSTAKEADKNSTVSLNTYMKNQLNSRMGASNYSTYKVATVIDHMIPTAGVYAYTNKQSKEVKGNGLGGNPDWPCSQVSGGSITKTFTVTRTMESVLLSYDNVSSINDSVNLTKTISFIHNLEEVHTSREDGLFGRDKYRKCTKWNYLSNITRADSASTATDKAALVNFNNHFTTATLNTDLLTISDSALATLINNNNTYWNAISGFSTAVRTKFLTNYSSVSAFMADCVNEQTARQYLPLVNYFHDASTGVLNVAYDTNNLQAMKTLQATATTNYNQLNGLNAATKTILNGRGMNLTQIKAWLDQLEKNIQLCRLRQIKAAADTGYNTTYADIENISDALLNAGIGEFQGYVNEFANMDIANINEVFTDGFQYIYDHLAAMKYEANKRAIELTFAGYVTYFENFGSKDYSKIASADTIAAIDAAQAKRTEYLAFYNNAITGLTGPDIIEVFGDYNAQITEYIDNTFKILEARITAQVKIGIDLYNEVGKLDWTNFTTVKAAIGQIETIIYDKLVNTTYMSAQTRADYLKLLGAILTEYNNFIKNPPHKKINLPLPVREVRVNDFARPDTAANTYDYEVTNDKLDGMITKIDNFLTSHEAAELLDIEGGSLEVFVKEKIVKELFSDKMINEIIAFMPQIAEQLPTLFKDVDTSMSEACGAINETLYMSNSATLYTIAEDLGLGVFPGLVAKNVTNATNKQLLDSTGTMAYDDTWEGNIKHFIPNAARIGTKTNWYDPRFYDAEDENFTFEWGITEIQLNPAEYPNWDSMTDLEKANELYAKRKVAFINVLTEILKGLEPLLRILLLGGSHAPSIDPFIRINGTINAELGADISFTNLTLFKDIVIPLFEMLGIENVSVPASNADTKTIVTALLDPIFNLIDQVSKNPMRTVINIMPNLSVYMILDKISPLLSSIGNVTIQLSPYGSGSGSLWNTFMGWLVGLFASIKVDLKFADIIADTGIVDTIKESMSDLNGILEMAVGLFAGDDDDEESEEASLAMHFPIINSGLIASLGTMETRSSKGPTATRSYVKADAPQVFLYLLQYLLGSIHDEAFFGAIMELVGGLSGGDDDTGGGGETTPPDSGGGDEEGDDLVSTILGFLDPDMDVDDAIAAIVELFYPVDYPLAEFTWVEPQTREFEYLQYKNNWTKEKANAIGGDLTGLVDTITDLAGIDLQETINELLADLFTADTLIDLAETLADLDLGDDVAVLVKDILGIDLSAWANLTDYNPVVESAEDFFDELYNLLLPIAPLIGLLLGDKDMEILGMIKFNGYEGYAYGLIPIFEALGLTAADGLMSSAAYKTAVANDTTGAATLSAVIDPIKILINKLVNNPVGTIEKMLPSLLYFLETGGLATSLSNILQSALVLLDTIRPIADIDLTTILGLVIGEEELEEGEEADPLLAYIEGTLATIDSITLGWIFGLLYELTGLNLSLIVGNAMTEMSYMSKPYTSLNGGSYYTSALTTPDLITILISVLIELLHDETNKAVIEELIEDEDGLLNTVLTVITSRAVEVDAINWYYFDPSIDPDDPFATWDGVTLPAHTIDYITPANNWSPEFETYLDENLDDIVNLIVGLVAPDATSVADLIDGSLDLYTDDIIQTVVDMIVDLTSELDASLLELVGVVLDVDLNAYATITWPEVTDRDSFLNALAIILEPVETLLNWLLFGEDMRFFHGSEEGTGLEDLIVINGTFGYDYGLVPILEALGVEGLVARDVFNAVDENGDAVYTFAEKIDYIVGPVLDRIDGILADPLNEILALIPNLVYFMNADGLTISLNNLLGGIYNILEDVEPIAEVDLDELLGFPISDLSLANILDLAEDATGLDLGIIKNYLTGLYIGQIAEYDSVTLDPAFKMTYSDAESRKDMITILFTLVFATLDDDNNVEPLKEMLGEDVYATIKNILHLDNFKVDIKPINWLSREDGFVFNAFENSEMYDYSYYRLWTKEKAAIVETELPEFTDNILALLGITIETEEIVQGGAPATPVKSVEDLLTSLLGTTIYTTDNLYMIVDAIKGLLAELDGLVGVQGAAHVKELLKLSLGVDLAQWDAIGDDTYAITTGDREAFINALNEILQPLTPVLEWLLTSKTFSFFVDEARKDYIVLEGAEGYAYGIIPVLEAFACNPDDILTPAEFAADKENMIKNILNPLLKKLDTVLADPINEIFKLIPGVVFFINSNGLDACFKNLLNAVYTILGAVEPLVKVDFYEMLGIELDGMTFDDLIALVLDAIEESTGYALAPVIMDTVKELSCGTVREFTSKNGELAYTLDYNFEENSGDMVTIIMRVVMDFVLLDENIEQIKALLAENADETSAAYISALLDTFADFAKSKYGMDSILGTLYYVGFGLEIATGSTDDFLNDLNASWKEIYDLIGSIDALAPIKDALDDFLNNYLDGILDPEKGVAPNGFIAFFQKIGEFFQGIFDFFRGLFGG